MTEFWRAVPNFPGYQVSSLGRVRSLDRLNSIGAKRTGKVLKPSLSNGHPFVVLCLEGIRTGHSVASLVLEAFVGKAPEGMVVKHIDRDLLNNHLRNLHWRRPVGEDAPAVKLTESQAKRVLALRHKGLTMREIGTQFNVADATVCRIINGQYWQHLTETAA